MSLRKGKKKGQETAEAPPEEEEDIITKDDLKIVDFLKSKTPTKRTKFLHQQVDYFYANKAVDVLLDSQWATGEEALFTDRPSCVDFLNRLLEHKFFHRAKKIAITDKDLKPKELKKKREKEEREKARRKKRAENAEDSEDTKKEESEREEKERKKKKKIKLDMHLEQVFVDGTDAYVWMYEPTPFWYNLAGAGLLLGVVAMCLFPLWPPVVRQGVYYLSVSAAGFLAAIMGLAVLRSILFLAIWLLSLGRHHWWLLPNLTKDVGFFESFWPLYEYEYRGSDWAELKRQKRRKKKKVTLLTDEEETKQQEEAREEGLRDEDTRDEDTRDEDTEDPNTDRPNDSQPASDSESHAFEMVGGEEGGSSQQE